MIASSSQPATYGMLRFHRAVGAQQDPVWMTRKADATLPPCMTASAGPESYHRTSVPTTARRGSGAITRVAFPSVHPRCQGWLRPRRVGSLAERIVPIAPKNQCF